MRTAGLLLLLAPAVLAHPGEPLSPHDLWSAWSFDPETAIPVVVAGILYARGARSSRGISRLHQVYFWAGWAALALALISPIHPLGEVLFSAHMIQHEILMLIAAPLLVAARPAVALIWGLPFAWRRAVGRAANAGIIQTIWGFFTKPLPAWWIHASAIWAWHIPYLFESTLANKWMHAAQHMSFFGTALLFWWSLAGAEERSGVGAGILSTFSTALHTGILGALLTFSTQTWYPAYARSTHAWGFTPLEDQQVGGLVMWVPAGVVYLAAGLIFFSQSLSGSGAREEKRYAP
jgi:putative membrane protein